MRIDQANAHMIGYQQARSFLLRHLVGLVWIDADEESPHDSSKWEAFYASGFLLSIRRYCFFATAGHIISDVKARWSAGRVRIHSGLHDSWHAPRQEPVLPYELDPSAAIIVDNKERGFDFGLLPIDTHRVRLLDAAKCSPLPEDSWAKSNDRFDAMVVVGFPREKRRLEFKDEIGRTRLNVRVGTPLLVCTPVPHDQAPTVLRKPFRRRYGRVLGLLADDGCRPLDLESLDGMSGGPVFGVRTNGHCTTYKLIGIQSSWAPSSRVIAACPVELFAEVVGEQLCRLRRANPAMRMGPTRRAAKKDQRC